MDDRPRTGEALQLEEPENPSRTDAEDWVQTYAQLTEFTEEMLRRTIAFLERMPGPAQRHLRSTNIRVMEEELTLFRERRSLWEARAARLH